MQPERRVAPRVRIGAPAEYRAGTVIGSGTIWDISASGARIESATALLDEGAQAALRCSFFPGSFGVELMGIVVRLTGTGFAMRFTDLGADQLEVLRVVVPYTRGKNERRREDLSIGCSHERRGG